MTDATVHRRPIRAVHLDLKGLPPTPVRLLQLPDVFAAAGFNAVLVEWEDAFPWTVDRRFRSVTAYTPQTVGEFAAKAEKAGVELIPLVQCLGHMETPLSVITDPSLREQPDQCDVLNVLSPRARPLVEAMVDDVLALMPGVRWFHLGGDEAWTFATHPDTKAYAQRHGKDALYLQHVEPTLDKLGSRGVRPLLWHDMMIDWSDAALRSLGRKADLVVWGYEGHPDQTKHHYNTRHIHRFSELGLPMWAAGAYKGADGMSADLPSPEARMTNARAWRELDGRFGFLGMIATAWSRYSTHRMQNEPIDAALDLMVRVGRLWRDGVEPSESDVRAILDAAGERERFEACRAAMAKLADGRRIAWRNLQTLEEIAALADSEPARRGSGAFQTHLNGLAAQVTSLDDAAKLVHAALLGLVDDVWIAEYLLARIEPLRKCLRRLGNV